MEVVGGCHKSSPFSSRLGAHVGDGLAAEAAAAGVGVGVVGDLRAVARRERSGASRPQGRQLRGPVSAVRRVGHGHQRHSTSASPARGRCGGRRGCA